MDARVDQQDLLKDILNKNNRTLGPTIETT